MKQIGVLHSMQVGTPQVRLRTGQDGRHRAWHTSFVRTPSPRPRRLFFTHLEGNQQADTRNHGKPDQAVLLYGAAHYPVWREELGLDIGPGGFGENFTIDGLTEWEMCVGDICAVGEARIQVTGPRYPCWKIEERWQTPGLTARVAGTGRTGWYCQVLKEGMVRPGASIELVERPYPRWTVALVNDFAHGRNQDRVLASELFTCPFLEGWWEDVILKQLAVAS